MRRMKKQVNLSQVKSQKEKLKPQRSTIRRPRPLLRNKINLLILTLLMPSETLVITLVMALILPLMLTKRRHNPQPTKNSQLHKLRKRQKLKLQVIKIKKIQKK
jgi:hypothetical protein